MIPVGYIAIRVAARPEGFPVERISDIYSVSGCISRQFADYIGFWAHNGYWLFDSPEAIRELASREKIDLSGQTFFYYEAYEREFDGSTREWSEFLPEPTERTQVSLPANKVLEGFDVVTFSARTSPEHSPLSCNLLASDLPVNEHCLFSSIDEAKSFLEAGRFEKSEPGPFRIFAVYTLA